MENPTLKDYSSSSSSFSFSGREPQLLTANFSLNCFFCLIPYLRF